MEYALFSGSTINIMIGFSIIALVLIALFTDSTPVKWVASLLSVVGLGILYKRLFPSDAEIKHKYKENETAANQYYEDRKNVLNTINENKQKVNELKEQKAEIDQEDEAVQEHIRILDTEIEQLEKRNEVLEKSVDERQKKLNAFFSRKDKEASTTNFSSAVMNSISGYRLKGDVE